MIEVNFEHWHYIFSEEDLQNGSPHQRKDIAKSKLRSALVHATLVLKTEQPILFEEEHIICANEAFPEAAIADPLADIEVWNEWRSGVRIFPYPGKYAKLSITHQLPKTSSTSSVGVIGEIMAGLFGQAIVGYDVLVRVIAQWPDFIFFPVNGRYSFLEAKAFTPQPDSYLDESFKIPKNVLGECLLEAISHLTIDPYVKVWYAFTEIQQVVPKIKFSVKFFELEVSDERRNKHPKITPTPVINGLAERAIQTAIIDFINNHPELLSVLSKLDRSNHRQAVEKILISISKERIFSVLANMPGKYKNIIFLDEDRIFKSVQEQIKRFKLTDTTEKGLDNKSNDTYYWLQPENENIQNDEQGIKFIRKIWQKKLYELKPLHSMIEMIANDWKPNIKNVNKHYQIVDSHKLWRCGSTIFFLSEGRPENLRVIEEYREHLGM